MGNSRYCPTDEFGLTGYCFFMFSHESLLGMLALSSSHLYHVTILHSSRRNRALQDRTLLCTKFELFLQHLRIPANVEIPSP